MEKIINIVNLRKFAYCNQDIIKKPIKAVTISFFGLGQQDMYHTDSELANRYAQQGILYLIPYNNPWAWMNRQTVALTEELEDVLFSHFNLDEKTPVIIMGGSMGGAAALTFTAYTKREPVACVTNCPVCDLPFHYTERGDLPRTLYSAFFEYDGTMEEAMKTASPYHLVDRLPRKTQYYNFHCDADTAVNKEKHSDRFVELMKKDHNITYYIVEGRGHCDLPENERGLYNSIPEKIVWG